MCRDQVTVSTSQVVALISDQAPAWCGFTVERLEVAGTAHTIFRIGESLTARFPLEGDVPKLKEEQLRLQAQAMTEFARVSAFPGPAPLFIGQPGHGYPLPWSIQTWINGDTAAPTSMAESFKFADDLASLICSLRSADTRGRTFDGENRGGDLTAHDAWVDECLARSKGLLDIEALHNLWARLRDLPHEDPDVMSHTDLIPANLIVAHGRLKGVLDTGDFRAADAALDLVCGWHLLDQGPRDALRASLGCSDVKWERGKAWAFEQAIGLVWFYERANPAMALLGRTTLMRILDDQHR